MPALKVRAKALYLSARDREAEDALLKAAARAPGDAEIPYDLGRGSTTSSSATRMPSAPSGRRSPSTLGAYKAWDNLGLTCEALGDVAEADPPLRQGDGDRTYRRPSYDVVYANYADLLIKEGHYRKAFDAAAEAAQRNPRDARNFLLAGKALVKLEAVDVAVKWLTQAVALDPTTAAPVSRGAGVSAAASTRRTRR